MLNLLDLITYQSIPPMSSWGGGVGLPYWGLPWGPPGNPYPYPGCPGCPWGIYPAYF